MVKLIGVALIALGVIALVYQGITYTSKEKILDVGPLKAEVDRELLLAHTKPSWINRIRIERIEIVMKECIEIHFVTLTKPESAQT